MPSSELAAADRKIDNSSHDNDGLVNTPTQSVAATVSSFGTCVVLEGILRYIVINHADVLTFVDVSVVFTDHNILIPGFLASARK